MRSFSIFLITIIFSCATGQAQDDDEIFYKNFGMNIGYAVGVPKYPALDGFKKHYDAEAGFAHNTMNLQNKQTIGVSGGFALFGFHDYHDFEYRVLSLKGQYDLPKNGTPQNYSFKLYQHSVRYSYNRGVTFGKFGLVGIYGGAALYAGTFGVKIKDPLDKKFQSLSIDNFRNFTIGVSPQLTLRLRFFELKAFYDYPFISNNLSPAYNKMFENAKVPDASSDANLKGKFSNLGICASFFIAFGEPKPRPQPRAETAEDREKMRKYNEDQKAYQQNREKENDASRKRIEDMQRQQEREQRRSNEKWGR